MMILIHVLIALISIGQSTVLLFSPSQKKLTINYGLFVATLASGSYLLLTMPSHMVQTCVEGLLYMGFVIGSIIIAKVKLAKKLSD